jgi:NADPH:quinone reductase-like Zn-dependent oxidoreductase
MEAYVFEKYGSSAEVLMKRTTSKPVPKEGFVLVKVHAVATNPLDFKVIAGALGSGAGPAEPTVPGWDAAGTIVDASMCSSSTLQAGEHVMWMPSIELDTGNGQGTFAQYALIDERILGKAPSSIPFTQAASIPLTYLTARTALEHQLQAQCGDSVLIVNGAGGVGSYAIQIARNLGCTVIATSGRQETTSWIRNLGAHQVADHSKPSISQALQDAGVNTGDVKHALLCAPPEKILSDVCNTIGPNGRITSILNYSADAFNNIDFLGMFLGQKGILNTAVLERNTMFAKHREWLNEAARLVDGGQIKPVSNALYQWDELTQALEHQESGRAIGKIVVKTGME